MNKRYLIFLAVFFGILFFVSGNGKPVFAGTTDNYGCSYDGCPGQWTHWWCDDSGWCSVGDCLGNPVSYCSWGGCSVSCGGGIQYNTCYYQCGGSYTAGSQACNTQACCTGVYGSCTAWGACSVSCGGGTQTRTCYDTGCGTAQGQNQACNTQACNSAPGAPALSAPSSGATGVSLTPVITLSATDANSDYLRYKIQIATDTGFTLNLQTFDQTVSQTGWSGQNSQTSTAYTSGSTATHTIQTALTQNTLYYLRTYAIDPGGTNTWSSASTTVSFTTTGIPTSPTISSPTASSILSTTPAITVFASDGQSDYLRYKIQICTDSAMTLDCQTFDQTASQTGWSGQNAQTNTAYTSGSIATYTVQTSLAQETLYYLRAYAIDPAGTNTWSAASSTISFTTKFRSPNSTPFGATAVPGRFGYARSFNGSSDYLSLGNNGLGALSGSFTIEAWVKTTSIAQQTIISEYQSGTCQDGRFYIQANTGYPVFDNGGGTTNSGNISVNDGVWHHVMYVYNSISSQGKIYVDGVAGTDTTAAAWRNTCATTDTRIGAEVGTAGAVVNGFSGTMDNIRVFNLPISDIKMKQLYYNGFVTGCTTGNAGYTIEAACPACPRAASYVDDGNCGKKLCAAC